MAWNGSAGASAPKTPPKKAVKVSAIHGVIALVVVLAIGAIAYLFVAPKGNVVKPDPDGRRRLIAEGIPAVVAIPNSGISSASNDVAVTNSPVERPVVIPRSARSGRVMTLKDGTVVTNTPRVIFERDLERTLMIALHPGAMSGAPLRRLRSLHSDAEIMQMLKEITRPEPGDDDVAVAVKNRVQAAKEEILSAVMDGKSLTDVFDELERRSASDGLLKATAFKLKIEALKSGDSDVVNKAIKGINKAFAEQGLAPVDVPVNHKISLTDDESDMLPGEATEEQSEEVE